VQLGVSIFRQVESSMIANLLDHQAGSLLIQIILVASGRGENRIFRDPERSVLKGT
jgi:hypothetical protein